MTIEHHDQRIRVSLSVRDWLYAVATIIGLVGVFMVAYLRHDRMLTELVSSQRMTEHRLTQIERNLP